MDTFISTGFKPAKAESMNQAAKIFATREAKRRYGRAGHCRTCTIMTYTTDGSHGEYQAFIGGWHKDETVGQNIYFTVTKKQKIYEQ